MELPLAPKAQPLPQLTIIPPQDYPSDFHSKAVSRSASPSTYRASPIEVPETPISQFHALRKRYLKNIWDWPNYLSDSNPPTNPSLVSNNGKPLSPSSTTSTHLSPFNPIPPSDVAYNATDSSASHIQPPPSETKKTLSQRKAPHITLMALTLFALAFIISASFSFFQLHIEPKYCRMSYMAPSFHHMASFDQNHTRLHSKYSLYLYREQNIDGRFDGSGIPVLFIPGNAGSYRQVRGLAAASSAIHDSVSKNNILNTSATEDHKFDYFTVDFQEDLTALHGKSLSDQAEYLNDAIAFILHLYTTFEANYPAPKSVILIGHSMGGVVARTMLTLKNHRKGSVNTIFTLTAPHTLAPVSFDREIVSIYESVNKYWEQSFSQDFIGRNPLASVSIISIAGGSLDHMIPSEYAGILSFVPPSNGFTVYTNNIPHVWAGIDHQAVVWCDQFRKVFAQAIHDMADSRVPAKTKSLPERMSVFRKHFLGGFDVGYPEYLQKRFHPSVQGQKSTNESFIPPKIDQPDTLLWVEDVTKSAIALGQKLTVNKLGVGPHSAHLMPIPKTASVSLTFSLLTDNELLSPDHTEAAVLPSKPYNFKSGNAPVGLYAMVCRYPFTETKSSGTLLSVIDLTRHLDVDESRLVGLLCKNIAHDTSKLPQASLPRTPLSPPSEYDYFSYLQYDVSQMADYDFVAIVDTNDFPTFGFVSAEFFQKSESAITLVNPLRDFFRGVSVRLPAARPVMVDISYHSIWSSLLAFQAQVISKVSAKSIPTETLFDTFVRQYSGDSYDSKYYLNIDDSPLNVTMFGVAPFSPFGVRETDDDFEGNLFYFGQKSAYYHNLHLQVWSDNSVALPGQEVEVTLKLDIVGSLGRLVLHYRAAVITVPIVVVALTLMLQFRIYALDGVFISFADGMRIFVRTLLFPIMLIVTLLPFFLRYQFVRDLLYVIEPGMDFISGDGPDSIFTNIRRNQFFLGLESGHLWFLGVVFMSTATGLCYLIQYVLLLFIHVLSLLYTLLTSCNEGKSKRTKEVSSPTLESPPITKVRRTIVTIFLFMAVAFTVPYEFAYIVSCFVQIFTSIRSYASRTNSAYQANYFNFVFSILMLMFWVALITLPMLAVWIREIATHGQIVFRSHHNVIAIGPVVFFVQLMSNGRMLVRSKQNYQRLACESFLAYIAFYALLFGLSRAYVIYHLVNVFMAWLVFLTLVDRGMHLHFLPSEALSQALAGADEKVGSKKNAKQSTHLRRRA